MHSLDVGALDQVDDSLDIVGNDGPEVRELGWQRRYRKRCRPGGRDDVPAEEIASIFPGRYQLIPTMTRPIKGAVTRIVPSAFVPHES